MNENGTRIEITTGTILRAIFLIIATWLVFVLKDIVLVVLTAVVIASCFEPLIKFFMTKRIPRVFAAIISYVLVVGILIGSFYTFVPRLLEDTAEFLNSVPDYLTSSTLWNPLDDEATANSRQMAKDLAENISNSTKAITTPNGNLSIRAAVESINEAITAVSVGFVHSASSIFGGVLAFMLIAVLSFYLAVQEDGIEKFLRIVVPDQQEGYVVDLWKRTQTKIGFWIQGQLLLALVVGLLVYVGLFLLGVRNALLFAVLAAFLEMIPLFGPIIAAIPAIATAYSDTGTSAAFIVAALYLVIQQLENHVIYPLVVKKIVGVPPILVILAVLVGFKLAGFLGLLLSVPLASMLTEFIDDMQKRKVGMA
jgi:predicted PurR-regulated permease PerM